MFAELFVIRGKGYYSLSKKRELLFFMSNVIKEIYFGLFHVHEKFDLPSITDKLTGLVKRHIIIIPYGDYFKLVYFLPFKGYESVYVYDLKKQDDKLYVSYKQIDF